MKNSQKKIVIILLLVIILVIGFILVNISNKKTEKKPVNNQVETESVVPTTDASTVATLNSSNGGKEVILKIEGIPNNTVSVDYELSYSTKQQGFQGVIGTISPDNTEKVFEKKITLGTCSSGKCVYHEVVGVIKTTLKFSGDYGVKILEKEFTL
ncbi:hypothetical protein COY87_01295 [Candidatus Roizmanbacteria bacterium CG_4_10_14_0_8_um_filter_33_9]|uniref:Uncharacterized protein n=1 Tax=Candidatus Roizmanbacteria bacterium CG_4_10_14_0_8_um_filter_33_9 TaxID=1974826 RepID=A0A2M7QJ48_9BACT|nr:MAG: hypothetical protein COY87_01295 [Candidatus Roizmanbacteria bacterium CG_4_10_14_0_8_um_filter_33_9]